MKSLVAHKIISQDIGNYGGIKILGDGELKVALTVKLPCSKSAKNKIEKAGGKVE
jgi:ribosomal protein L15